MIQRIQSVYLLLCGLCPLLTFAVPFARASQGDAAAYFYSCHAEGLPATFHYVAWDTAAAALLVLALSLWAIFSYKRRKRQVMLARIAAAVDALWLYFAAVHVAQYTIKSGADAIPYWGALFPVLSVVFAVLAWRAVKRDEELVRAADRIR